MHLHLGAAFLILLIVAAVLFPYYGWALVVWPVAIIAGCVVLFYALRYSLRRLARLRGRRARRALEMRRSIARLEAEQGIPLLTDGACANCGKPLIAGAHYCSYCKAPTKHAAQVCDHCGTRNAGDAIWCGTCGSPLAYADKAESPQTWRAALAATIADMLDAVVD